jgi:hypothetical protein
MIGDASARAAELVAGARADAAATLANAEAAAASAIDQARGEGVRAAEATVQAQLIASRRAARTLVLDAQHDVEAAARVRAIGAAMAFRERPEYQRLLDNLEANSKHRLGSAAEIVRDGSDGGGVRARAGKRSLDYTLTSLAVRALDDVLAGIDEPARSVPVPTDSPA